MKKIISLILIAILCLGVLTSCAQLGGVVDSIKDKLGMGDEQPAEGPSLDEAVSYLHKIYKDKKETTRTDFDVVAVVVIDGVKFPVTWTSDNANVVVRESTKTGYYTVDLPDVNAEEFSYTLTATISNADGETASKSYTFKVPTIDNSSVVSDFEEGKAYNIGFYQASLQENYYIIGQMNGYYMDTTKDINSAVNVYVEIVDGGYNVYCIYWGEKLYINMVISDTGYVNPSFDAEAKSVYTFNSTLKTLVCNINNSDYGFGVKTEPKDADKGTYYTTLGPVLLAKADSSYFITLSESTIPDQADHGLHTPEAIINAAYELEDGEFLKGTHTLTGIIKSIDTPYDSSYKNLTVTIVVGDMEDKPMTCYRLKGTNAENLGVGDEITVTGCIKNHKGTIEFDSGCTFKNWVDNSESGNEGGNQGGNTPETPDTPSDLGIVTSPEVGVAYKFGLFHGNEKANVFFNGQNYNNYAWYLAYAAAGVDVYLETVEGVEGGYRIYFMNGDAKTYIVAFPRDGDTTKGTLKLDTTTPAEYFTFNTEYNTLVYTSTTGEQFYLGSSGTYKSISCSAISYITNADSYVSHLYAAGATGGEGGEVTPPEGGEGDEPVTPPVTDGNEIIFDFGANGTAGTHADGNDIGTSKTYTSGNYSLVITDALKAYDGGFDKAGNSILKLGTGSVAGTITFTVPANVNSVVIYAARYKNYADNNMIVVNGVSYTLTKNSDDGEYEAITVDTTTNKTVTVASTTDATKPRCVVNSIVWVLGEGGSETPDTPVDPQPPVHEHNFVEGKCECGETDPNYVAPEAPAFGVVTPVAGTAYKFGMVQSKAGKTVYLKGGMSGYYMATTEDINAAIDVYLEETTDGYYLYTLNADGSKLYINMVVSGTHVNGAYEAAASTVYTIDADRKSIVATVNDELYHFGTRNDNTYLTVGPCKVSYNGFDCQFYGATGF